MSDQPSPARSFGDVADAYDRARPTYPTEAVAWALGERPVTVLELGAGTGKLTETVVALGHDVHATDPDEQMLAVLRAKLPDVRTSCSSAEEIPAPDASYDVVVVAQAFHWFDHERALPEIARVLKPGGWLAVVTNTRDERIPWVRKLGALIGSSVEISSSAVLEASTVFGEVEEERFKHWQQIDRTSIQELVLSRSNVAMLDEDGRRAKLAEVLAFYDDYGRGMDGMQLPYVTACRRTVVVEQVRPAPTASTASVEGGSEEPAPAQAPPTDEMLLIDFR